MGTRLKVSPLLFSRVSRGEKEVQDLRAQFDRGKGVPNLVSGGMHASP